MKWSSNNVLSLKSSRDEKAKKGLDTSWEDALLAEIGYPVEPTNASQSSVPQRAQVAANAIKGQRNHGSDDQTIFDSLKYQGYTDDEIEKAFELAG